MLLYEKNKLWDGNSNSLCFITPTCHWLSYYRTPLSVFISYIYICVRHIGQNIVVIKWGFFLTNIHHHSPIICFKGSSYYIILYIQFWWKKTEYFPCFCTFWKISFSGFISFQYFSMCSNFCIVELYHTDSIEWRTSSVFYSSRVFHSSQVQCDSLCRCCTDVHIRVTKDSRKGHVCCNWQRSQ